MLLAESPTWTVPVVLTLIISLMAFVTAVTALGWQVYAWTHEGARVEVRCVAAFTWGPMGNRNLVAISATNTGRSATRVHSFGFETPNKRQLMELESAMAPVPLPQTLEPGAEVSYWYEPSRLAEALREEGLEMQQLRPYASTGHGRVHGKPLAKLPSTDSW